MSNIIENNYTLITHVFYTCYGRCDINNRSKCKKDSWRIRGGDIGDSPTIPKGMVGEFANYPEIVNRRA